MKNCKIFTSPIDAGITLFVFLYRSIIINVLDFNHALLYFLSKIIFSNALCSKTITADYAHLHEVAFFWILIPEFFVYLFRVPALFIFYYQIFVLSGLKMNRVSQYIGNNHRTLKIKSNFLTKSSFCNKYDSN